MSKRRESLPYNFRVKDNSTIAVLESTKNTRAVALRVLRAARAVLGVRKLRAFFEHGHWWVENPKTGAQYDAVDTDKSFGFEQVTQGDED